jgi:hypothetical protein
VIGVDNLLRLPIGITGGSSVHHLLELTIGTAKHGLTLANWLECVPGHSDLRRGMSRVTP